MEKNDQRRLFQAAVLTVMFVATVAGAWAWYHVNPKRFPVSYVFHAVDTIAGYEFKAEPVGDEAVQTLATTNLFNGLFRSDSGERFTVFMGTWDAARSKELAVVGHTPDICWVGAGAVPVSVGQPDQMELDFSGTKIPFEVRAFQMPGTTKHLELTVWCTLISGQVFAESDRFELKDSSVETPDARKTVAGRRLARMHLVRAIRERVPGDGSKQFVRFSTSLDGDWQTALGRLAGFSKRWLQLNSD